MPFPARRAPRPNPFPAGPQPRHITRAADFPQRRGESPRGQRITADRARHPAITKGFPAFTKRTRYADQRRPPGRFLVGVLPLRSEKHEGGPLLIRPGNTYRVTLTIMTPPRSKADPPARPSHAHPKTTLTGSHALRMNVGYQPLVQADYIRRPHTTR